MALSFTRLLFPRLGIAFAILAVMALSPARGAACGNEFHGVDPWPMDVAIPFPVSGKPGLPCDGPNCSSKPATPAPPITAPGRLSDSSKSLSSDLNAATIRKDFSKVLRRRLRLRLPASHPSEIFHPPRAR